MMVSSLVKVLKKYLRITQRRDGDVITLEFFLKNEKITEIELNVS